MRGILVGLLLLVLGVASALADERILSFDSHIVVAKDASIDVTETIRVSVENDQIRHGIYRDFPTRYSDTHGRNVIVGFTVLSVKRDGHTEPYTLESLSNGVRIRIGDKDVIIPRGYATYEIRYRATRELGFFPEYDELYWNVTGNGWIFPIDAASVTVDMPPGAHVVQSAGYIGSQGASGRDFATDSTPVENRLTAHTTAPLGEYEGFTIAVAWPKGLVTPPGAATRALWLLEDNIEATVSWLGVILVAFYFYRAWDKVGRDPRAGVTVPLFRPPEDMTAPAMRYLREEGFDKKTFSSALIGLAVKGHLKISDSGGTYTLIPKDAPLIDLSRGERAMMAAIGLSPLTVSNKHHDTFEAVKSGISNALDAEFLGKMFNRNRGRFFLGLGLSVLAIVLAMGANEINNGFDPASFNVLATAGAVVVLLALNITFFNLLPARTQVGRLLLDKIEGFRMYLATTEEDRLNVLNPPERTPELFERYLPYAIALDCENQWGRMFTKVLAAANAGAPSWYIGPGWYPNNPSRFTSSLSSSLTNSAASASVAPGSSSGSGGGGSSGGGGGGGGGGGW